MFNVPDYDSVNTDGPNLPSEGWHNAVMAEREATEARSGRDMMVITWKIDSGSWAGHEITEYIVFNAPQLPGEQRLKQICEAAQFRWEKRPTLDAFVEQFPEGEMRLAVKVEWQYSIKKSGDWENVPAEAYEGFDGDKNVRAVPAGYREASGESELAMQAAGADEQFVPDDEMPF